MASGGAYSQSVDVYAVGLLLWSMRQLSRPWPARDPLIAAALAGAGDRPPMPSRRFPPDLVSRLRPAPLSSALSQARLVRGCLVPPLPPALRGGALTSEEEESRGAGALTGGVTWQMALIASAWAQDAAARPSAAAVEAALGEMLASSVASCATCMPFSTRAAAPLPKPPRAARRSSAVW